MTCQAPTDPVFDAFVDGCPSRDLLGLLGSKWVLLALCALDGAPQRYSELARRLAGVSQKMLTQTLRELERAGLVARTVTASVPVRVDYELTALGRSLLPVVAELKGWAETHMPEVNAHRRLHEREAVGVGH